MGIRVLPNGVQIGNYYLTEGPGGIVFNGSVYSRSYRQETQAQGEVSGFVAGGSTPPFQNSTQIDAFPFATTAPAINFGTFPSSTYGGSGNSSSTNGYGTSLGGIVKFAFASKNNGVGIGNLSLNRQFNSGQSSTTHGYTSGGDAPTPVTPNPFRNIIDKFPFATDTNATAVGDLTVAKREVIGQSSVTHGYASGGNPTNNVIERFPFATDTNATDIGDLTVTKYGGSGHSSTVSGYTAAGIGPPGGAVNVIDKFPFATNVVATDVGDIASLGNIAYSSGISSVNSGYIAGGGTSGSSPSGFESTSISTFPFAVDSNSTLLSQTLAQSRGRAAGCQF